MSDLMVAPIGIPIDEQIRQNQAMQETAKRAVAAALAQAGTNIAPDPTLPGVYGYIPLTGAAEGLTGFAGTAYDLFRSGVNKVLDQTGIGKHLEQLGAPSQLPAPSPVFENAGKRADRTFEEIYGAIPHGTDDPEYDPAKTMGRVLGNVIPVAPGAPVRALGPVGSVVRHLVPTTEGAVANAAIGGTLAAGLGAAEAHAQNQPLSDVDQLLNPPQQQQQQEKRETPGVLPGVDQLLNQGTPTSPGPAPTFGAEGESGWTVGQILAGLGTFAAVMLAGKYLHGLGTDVTMAARDARMNNPDLVQKATDFNNTQIAAKGGTQISGNEATPPMPTASSGLPGSSTLNTIATAAKDNTLDANAWLQNYVKLTSENPDASTQLSHQIGMIFNDMSHQGRMRSFLETGVDDATGLKMPIPKRLFDDIGALSDADKQKFNDGMMAANELDNRLNNQQKGITAPNNRYDFANQSDQDLARLVVDMQSDPVLRDLQDRYKQISSRLISIGEGRGFFTAAEARDIRNAHPNHVADVDNTGRIMHAMGPRVATPYTGVPQVNTNAWSSLAQHIEALYRQYELNDLRGAVVSHQLDVQRQFPQSAQWLERVRNVNYANQAPSLYPHVQPMGTGVRDQVLSVRRGTGVEFYRVKHPDMYDILSGNNATKARALFEAANFPRRLLQTGTTGIASTLTGRIFPFVNLARTAIQAPINRPPGYVGSLSDLVAQRLTGGRLGYRGLDPTNFLGAGYALGRRAFDRVALGMSDMFDKTNANYGTQLLKSILSPTQMDVIRDGLKKYYLGTVTHEMESQGVGGMGVPFRTRLPAFQRIGGESPTTIRLVSGQLSPHLFFSGGRLGTIKAYRVAFSRVVQNIFSSISDASHEYFYRLNRFNDTASPQSLAYETRNLVGDPGVAGRGRIAGAIATAVPYSNVSAQGISRFGRALKETPIGTTASLVGSLGSLALLSIMTSMRSDNHKDYLENHINTQGRAGNVVLFTHDDPSINTQFSLPQELRPFYTMLLDVISKAVNLTATKHDDNAHDGVLNFLKDWFSEHIENSTWQSALQGLAAAGNIIDVPPAINLGAAVGGNTLRMDIARMVNDAQSPQGITPQTFNMPVGTDAPLPNHPPGDSLMEGQTNKVMSAMMSAIFGITGTLWDQAAGFHRYYKQTDDFWRSLGQVGRDWVQRAQDLNPELNNVLWENRVRESMRPPVVEKVQRSLDAMKQLAGATSAERMEGTTGGPRPLPVTPQTGPSKVPTNPVMRNMYFATSAEYNFIQSHVMADITALKKQTADIGNQPMNPDERRKLTNDNTRKIIDKYRYIQSRIDDLNASFSRQIGKHVDVSQIEWDKGPEQFR